MSDHLQQMQRLQLAGTLAGGIAHDLNDQLTLILGNLDLAIGRLPDGYDAFDMLEHAKAAASRCAEMSRRLLYLGFEKPVNLVPMDIAAVVSDAMRLLECIKPPNTKITVNSEDALYILGDTNLIQQALLNLGTNAFHAMPHGGEVELRAWQQDQRVNVAVRDTGCGISASLRKRIFEPFFTTHAEIGLSGLGLTTVRSIMSTHDGLVGIESIPGKGSTLRLSFPCLRPPE